MRFKQRVVFFRARVDIEDVKGDRLSVTAGIEKIDHTIAMFNCGDIETLIVPVGMVTGWKSSVKQEDVGFCFAGDDWSVAEIMQALHRFQYGWEKEILDDTADNFTSRC